MPDVSLLSGACQCQTQNLGKCKAGPTSKTTIKGKTSGETNKYETFSRLFGHWNKGLGRLPTGCRHIRISTTRTTAWALWSLVTKFWAEILVSYWCWKGSGTAVRDEAGPFHGPSPLLGQCNLSSDCGGLFEISQQQGVPAQLNNWKQNREVYICKEKRKCSNNACGG